MRLTPHKHPTAGYAHSDAEANGQLAKRAARHMAMRNLRIPPVHGANCNCHGCTLGKHAKAVR